MIKEYKKRDFLEDAYPKRLFYPFTDRFIQEYYHYNYQDLDYFLKSAVLFCPDVYITGANIWQGDLSYALYKTAKPVIDDISEDKYGEGLIHLATRKRLTNYQTFDNYFDERSQENEHFLPLPGILSMLDFQLPDKRDIAKELDDEVLPAERVGQNVSALIAKRTKHIFQENHILLDDNMAQYFQGKMISRLAIANYIIHLPYCYQDITRFILESNRAYYEANAESNNSYLIYPKSKYSLVIHTNKKEFHFTDFFTEVGLTRKYMEKISFQALKLAKKNGILSELHRNIRYLVNANRKSAVRKLILAEIKILTQYLVFISRDGTGYDQNPIRNNQQDLILGPIYNLNWTIANGGSNVDKKEITVSTMIDEITRRLSMDQIKNVCIRLFDDYEQFPNSNKIEFARELCLACKREERMSDLLSACLKECSTFNLLSNSTLIPAMIREWRDSTSGVGDILSESEYEKRIESYNRFQSVYFLQRGLEVKDRICMITASHPGGRIRATGFLLKSKEYVLTNRHVFPSKDIVKTAEAVFGYEDGDRNRIHRYRFDTSHVYISDQYDLAIAKLETPVNEDINFHNVYIGQAHLGDIVPIIQHPNGMPKQICIGHNSLKYADDEIIQYLTDTMPGSSGSPVFNSKWELIGLHSKGGNISEPRTGKIFLRNEGVSIAAIKKFFESISMELDIQI